MQELPNLFVREIASILHAPAFTPKFGGVREGTDEFSDVPFVRSEVGGSVNIPAGT